MKGSVGWEMQVFGFVGMPVEDFCYTEITEQ